MPAIYRFLTESIKCQMCLFQCALFFADSSVLFNWLEVKVNSVPTENELHVIILPQSTNATIHWESAKTLLEVCLKKTMNHQVNMNKMFLPQ